MNPLLADLGLEAINPAAWSAQRRLARRIRRLR